MRNVPSDEALSSAGLQTPLPHIVWNVQVDDLFLCRPADPPAPHRAARGADRGLPSGEGGRGRAGSSLLGLQQRGEDAAAMRLQDLS